MAAHSLQRATATVTIRTSPERAFDAWLDPAIARVFLGAGEYDVSVFESEPVEGGAFRLVMSRGDTHRDHEGRYVVIDRPRRLVFTWISDGTDRRLSLVTVTFTPVGDGVRVDLEHEGIPDAERAGRHQAGWTSILEKLARTFG